MTGRGRTRPGPAVPKQKPFKVHWIEWPQLPRGLGHGIEIHSRPGPDAASLLAFLEGFDWYHGKTMKVTIFTRRPDQEYSAAYMARVREELRVLLNAGRAKDLKNGEVPFGDGLFAWLNG